MVTYRFQCTGNLIFAQIYVHHHREAQCDCACTGGNNHLIQRAKGIDECRNTVLCVLQQAAQITGLYIAENQCRTNSNGHNVDHRGHIVTQRNYTQFQTHFDADLDALLDHVAHQEGHNTLGLIILYNRNNICGIVGLTQYNRHTGNVSCNQRHTQRTNNGVGHKANTGLICIGVTALCIL